MTYSPLGHHISIPNEATSLEREAIALEMALKGVQASLEYFRKVNGQAGLDAMMRASMYIAFGEWD